MKAIAKVRTSLGDYFVFKCDCVLETNEYLAVHSYSSPSEIHPYPKKVKFAIDYIWETVDQEVNVPDAD